MSEPIYSPGLEGIVAGETAVSTIEGGLRYRGYSVEELAAKSSFEATAYLLLKGELPNAAELDAFCQRLASAAPLPQPIVATLRSLPTKAPMMDVMRTGASMLAHWDPEIADNGHDANVRKAERLLAQMPTVLATALRLRQGQDPIPPRPGDSLAKNLLWMLSGREPKPQWIDVMDDSLIMYAEHEFNASTFAARVVASTLADLHSAIVAGIGALKGPLHGGANERVLEVLQSVGSAANAEKWVRDAFSRKEKIMGFGHRVYKDGDPRARYLKPFCEQLAAETGNQDLEQTAAVIERMVWDEKRIPPNLDWPSARLYHYMGLPVELYTPLFVVSRVTGWSAHIIEQLDNNRLIRPRSRYAGHPARAL
jgi:2-methylcitrate synthase/citrate synthase II